MCGEHDIITEGIKSVVGSSPHVRGALNIDKQQIRHGGIIPACAGSTMAANNLPINFRDHPRMCGEHFFMSVQECGMAGSSPHVRGAPGEV